MKEPYYKTAYFIAPCGFGWVLLYPGAAAPCGSGWVLLYPGAAAQHSKPVEVLITVASVC